MKNSHALRNCASISLIFLVFFASIGCSGSDHSTSDSFFDSSEYKQFKIYPDGYFLSGYSTNYILSDSSNILTANLTYKSGDRALFDNEFSYPVSRNVVVKNTNNGNVVFSDNSIDYYFIGNAYTHLGKLRNDGAIGYSTDYAFSISQKQYNGTNRKISTVSFPDMSKEINEFKLSNSSNAFNDVAFSKYSFSSSNELSQTSIEKYLISSEGERSPISFVLKTTSFSYEFTDSQKR